MEYTFKENYITFEELTKRGLFNAFSLKAYDFRADEDQMPKQLEEVKRFVDDLGISPVDIFSMKQVHSDKLINIDNERNFKDFGSQKRFDEVDGLITSKKDIMLFSKYADCIPVIIYDEVRKVQANVHSGWRGTSKRIVLNAISRMEKEFNTKVEDLLVVQGPAIGAEDFEVTEDVYEIFSREFSEYRDTIVEKDKTHWTIDTKEINKRLLLAEGVLEENIFSIDLSTYADERFHSYRRDKANYGLMACFTMLL